VTNKVVYIFTAVGVPVRILLFYMSQLWALHVAIKRQFFYIYICSFSTKFISQMHDIAQAYLRCCGVTKTNGSHTGILLAVSIL